MLLQKKNSTFKKIKWKFIAYPIIVVFTVFSLPIVLFTILPTINNIGFMAFSYSEDVLLNYYILPFTCINMCILLGYGKLVKKMASGICSYFSKRN